MFATAGTSQGLLSVSAGGGQEPKELTKPGSGGADHIFPSILPGGRAVLFTILSTAAENSQVAVLDLGTGEQKVLIQGGSQAEYVGGFLAYGVAGTLRAVQFDLTTLEVQGDAVPVVDRVTMGPNGSVQFAVSETGALTYALTTDPTNHAATGFAGANQLLFTEYEKNNSNDLAMMTMDTRQRTSLVASPFDERNATVSPDGRFIAYASARSDEFQVFVSQFPDVNGGSWQISTTGGVKPVWSHDGKELFYQRPVAGQGTSEIYVAAIATTPTFSTGNPVKLFDLRGILSTAIVPSWDVARDGKRFIAIKNEAATAAPATAADRPSFVFIVNWVEELKAKLGAGR